MYAGLKSLQHKMDFPLVEQTYYPDPFGIMCPPPVPFVVKIGNNHAAVGKALVKDTAQMQDIVSLLKVTDKYVQMEPYIQWHGDYRVQKIGGRYRAYRRDTLGWKANDSAGEVEEVEVTPSFREWVDGAASLFGGLDICALDILHRRVRVGGKGEREEGDAPSYGDIRARGAGEGEGETEGSETSGEYTDEYAILEVNDTPIGLMYFNEDRDVQDIVDLVLVRMEEEFGPKSSTDNPCSLRNDFLLCAPPADPDAEESDTETEAETEGVEGRGVTGVPMESAGASEGAGSLLDYKARTRRHQHLSSFWQGRCEVAEAQYKASRRRHTHTANLLMWCIGLLTLLVGMGVVSFIE
ncbi:synapsin [Kipferlia bialata]|uniref:Synapsin n=1 Tax=Kipferlia bialata TaxID=797122 RepID=A0A9K3CR73_9EUKA|nr:synapsin [Kipferlia bialata]GIQ84216.1 synapsin [Kipferlia bialata]|eukprot:g2747.t1